MLFGPFVQGLLENSVHRGLDFLCPPHCLVCDAFLARDVTLQLSGSPHTAGEVLCHECNPFLSSRSDAMVIRTSSSKCKHCGENLAETGTETETCTQCAILTRYVREMRSLLYYTESVERIVKELKYAKKRRLGLWIGDTMARYLANPDSPIFTRTDWDFLVPIPSSNRMLRERGFFPVGLMSAQISKRMKIPLKRFAFENSSSMHTQTSLPPYARRKNMTRALHLRQNDFENRSVLLIDDMLTTGSTAEAAARILLLNGARSVDLYTFARVKHFQQKRLQSFLKPNERAGSNTEVGY